jgi:hypothetical protein
VVQSQNPEAIFADRLKVQATIRQALHARDARISADRMRLGGAADFRAGADERDAERLAGLNANVHHLAVARLEDVQGQGHAGKEDDA